MAERISFYGAAGTVTGSCHLVEYNDRRILVDCGIFQGSRQLRDLNYDDFPFEVPKLDAVIATHAHQDHIGRVPKLVKEGYQGPIFATPASVGIAKIALPDAGRIQEEDARRARKHGSRHADPQPLFTEDDAYLALKRFVAKPYGVHHELPGGAHFRFHHAGHILGSSFVEITFPNGNRLLMGGDLGRYNTPIIRDPAVIDGAEYLVVESTYGDRLHGPENPEAAIFDAIQTVFQRGGVLVVPSFAIGRTQELLFYIRKMQREGRLPRIPIAVDSPMAVSATHLYESAKDEHDEEMHAILATDPRGFEPDGLTLVRDKETSKSLNRQSGPMIVIAGSGMANGGRIQHHLLHRLHDPANMILFTGYQAEGTLGRELVEGAETVEIMRHVVPVRAEVRKLSSLSAHADRNEIATWLGHFKSPPRHTFVVHGEPRASQALSELITSDFGWRVSVPEYRDTFNLD